MSPTAGPLVPGSTNWPTEPSPSPGGFWHRLLGRARRGADSPVPGSIGRYRVVRKLGEGGMGVVFEAEDDVLGRRVAVKRLKSGDEASRRRFLREARAAARLSHPNVCHIYEVAEDSQGLFLAMELLVGEPLSRRLERGPLSPAEAVSLGAGMLAALSALHAAGIVHRDLKPSNVYLGPHGARLLDFGLARAIHGELARVLAGDSGDRTHPDLLVGSPRYMAPEQILGHDVDARTDVFSAGAVLYEAFSGRAAFTGAKLAEVLTATLYDNPRPLEGAAAPFDGVVRRALAKAPADRFPFAESMAEALREAASPPARVATAAGEAANARDAFAGRAAELAQLQARFASALAGAGHVVFVTGERGTGKSALVAAFLKQLRACPQPITVARGRCMERLGPGETFLPFLDAFGRFLSTRARNVAVDLIRTWAPTVGIQMPAALVPDPDGSLHRQTAGATRERLVREAGDFVEAATRLYPLVLVLEDLQWADAASVDLLCHLGRRIPSQRLLLLGTYRPSDAEALNPGLKRGALDLRAAGLADELPLGPLAVGEVAEWLDGRFAPNDFPAALARALHARAEGRPLFVRALAELLVARGDVRHEAVWTLARPLAEVDLEPSRDVKDLVRAQLESIPAADRGLLEAASVLGKEFSSPVAAALAGGDALDAEERLLRLARVHRVLEPLGDEELPDGTLGARYRFAHGLFQRVLYDDLVAPRRAQLHRTAAELLTRHWGEEAPMLAAQVAEHYELGRDPASAARFRTRAGDNASRRFAAAEAEEQYTCALKLLDRLPRPERRSQEIGLLRRRAAARYAQARFEDAVRDYEAMLERARAVRSLAGECDALNGLGSALFFAQRVSEVGPRVREGLAAAEREGSPHRLSEAHARLAQLLVVEGRLEEAGRALDDVISSARASGAASALGAGLWYRGFVHYWRSEYASAESLSAEGAVLAEELGNGFDALGTRMFQGLALVNLGRVSDGLATFQAALSLAERNRDSFWGPRLVSHLGWIHRELQDPAGARAFDARALEVARESPSPWAPASEALIGLFVDDVRAGRTEGAGELLDRLERERQGGWMGWMSELRLEAAACEHCFARGDHDRALSRATRLVEIARSLGARTYRCTAERVRLAVALDSGHDLEAAAGRLEVTLAEFDSFPAPLETWKAARVLGLAWERLGRAEQARRAFEKAAGAIRTLADGTQDEALRSGFLASAMVREVTHRPA